MAQVSHGGNAGHARSALERVQGPLQCGPVFRARGDGAPIGQGVFGRVDQLERFLAENGGDFRIEVTCIVDRLLRDRWRRLRLRRRRDGRRTGVLRTRLYGSSGRRSLRRRRMSRRQALVQHRLGLAEAMLQIEVSDKVAGRLIEVRRHGLHGLHAVRQ